jgi:hypothetical protein
MERIKDLSFPSSSLFCLVLMLLFAACSKATKEPASPAPAPVSEVTSEEPSQALPAGMAGVQEALRAGSFDDAAARLLELQASSRNFTQREAADYRKAMNEAYTRALEAAEKGDARAEAAIRMIRAANAR